MKKILFEGKEYDAEKIKGFWREGRKIKAVIDDKIETLIEYESEELAIEGFKYLDSLIQDKFKKWINQFDKWDYRTKKFCPFTRQPCEYVIDPKGEEIPENMAQCQFYKSDMEACSLLWEITEALMSIKEFLEEKL